MPTPDSEKPGTEVDPLLAEARTYFQPLEERVEHPTNPITPEKVELGKMLYFDTRLSRDGKNSCNSCHNLASFGVDNLPTSQGDAGGFGNRNSPTVLNAAFHSTQFWDGRAKDVEEQAGGPILNPDEMNIPSEAFLVSRLQETPEYPALFRAAFPGAESPVTFEHVRLAIAAFERTLVTPSPFDRYLEGDTAALSKEQRKGLKTFIKAGCTQCHNGPLLGGNSFQKFGVHGDYRSYLPATAFNDEGRKTLTGLDADKDMFKVPTLRNVEKTAPYFHNGSIRELGEAVSIMGKSQLNKDLTPVQVSQIVAFMEALTGTLPAGVSSPPAALAQSR